MKYRYIGQDNSFCLELTAYNIKGEHGDYLFKGDVIEVDDKLTKVIDALNVHPWFEKVTSKVANVKANKKNDEDK